MIFDGGPFKEVDFKIPLTPFFKGEKGRNGADRFRYREDGAARHIPLPKLTSPQVSVTNPNSSVLRGSSYMAVGFPMNQPLMILSSRASFNRHHECLAYARRNDYQGVEWYLDYYRLRPVNTPEKDSLPSYKRSLESEGRLRMNKNIVLLLALLFSALIFSPSTAFAQEKYPSRPIHFIVPMTAGGGTDRVARALSEALKNHLPQPVLVENQPGAGSVVGMSKLHTSKPDGYTLGVVGGYLITTTLQGMAKFPATDFTLVARTSGEAFCLTVPVDSKYRSLSEIITASQADPDKITLANAGTGALTHLASVAINQSAGAKFRFIPFEGGAKELTAVLGAHVDAGVFSLSEVLGHSVSGGKLRTLVVFSEKRSPLLPDVPTLQELGIKGIPEGPWQGVAAPKGLPDDIRAALIEAVHKAVQEPSWKEFMEKFGYADRFLPGKEFERFFEGELQVFEKLIRAVEQQAK
jgi:tripartite-type tricarboxylate transporter receptor subunit TctC